MKDNNVIIRIDTETKEQFQAIAKKEERSASDILLACIRYINRNGHIPDELVGYLKHPKKPLTLRTIKTTVTRIIEGKYADDVTKVYLFGSYARQEATSESDVDLLIKTSSRFSMNDLAHLLRDMQKFFRRPVDIVVDTTDLDPEFLANVKADRILLYEKRN